MKEFALTVLVLLSFTLTACASNGEATSSIEQQTIAELEARIEELEAKQEEAPVTSPLEVTNGLELPTETEESQWEDSQAIMEMGLEEDGVFLQSYVTVDCGDNEHVKHISDKAALELIFWHRMERKVRSDGTITIQRKLFQVPLRYVGTRIEVRFDNYPPKEVFVFEGDVSICPAEPVAIHENAHVRRSRDIPETPIDFKNIFTGSGGDE